MINDYINNLCDILNISIPSVSYDTNNFPTSTMMAQCNSSGTTIYIKKKDKPDPDYMFAIAHELRHIWQIKTDKQLYFSDYHAIDEIGLESYNLQIAELDANAFGMIVMKDFFHLQAQFYSVSKNIKTEIYKRASTIESSLHS